MSNESILIGEERPDLLLNETLVDIFKSTSLQYPQKTALIFDNLSITYQELDQWSNDVAITLIDRGVRYNDRIGVWLHRSLELHVAILGILKAGAAYVPFDREIPAERVGNAFEEVGVKGYFSDSLLPLTRPVFKVPNFESSIQNKSLINFAIPDGEAYILHTSGSTGKPKGIAITHKQICHLARAEQDIFGLTYEDKVYQGISVSFDMWCEETWISYLAGATLWVADAATAKAIDELTQVLKQQKITVLHSVPSLLAVINDDIPTLRIINAGGEACTTQVLNAWAKPGRQFYNSYGPTEITVSATIARLKQNDKVTIGYPLPNYGLAVVDDNLNPVQRGEGGELVISGPGVSKGYVNREDLTIEKFVEKPATLKALPGNRIYKTGDAAIINPDGSIDYQGRLDDQVKLRGYRIELGEIENRLLHFKEVKSAAACIKKDSAGNDHLISYVVTDTNEKFDQTFMRGELAMVLPAYMMPEAILHLLEMPRLTSGKIDKKALPLPDSISQADIESDNGKIDINSTIEDKLLNILKKIFPGRDVKLTDDFFTDLGGHSLLAATFISRMRAEGGMPDASLREVYQQRPLQKLADAWKAKPQRKTEAKNDFLPTARWRHTLCWVAQTLVLPLIYGLFGLQIFLPYLMYYYVQQELSSHLYAILASLASFCLIPGLFSCIIILTKWTVIGRIKPGKYPLWGSYYFRWWFVKTVQDLLPTSFLNGTPLYATYLRLLGVKVSSTAQISAVLIGAEDLIQIGDNASISSNVILNNARVENGWLKIGSISIGSNAYIGSNSIVDGETVLDDWAELRDLSYLPSNSRIKENELWQGSPAQHKYTKKENELHSVLTVSNAKRRFYQGIFLGLLLIFPIAILLPLLPIIITINELDNAVPDYDFGYLVWMPLLSLAYIIFFSLETIIINRILLKGIKPGNYPVYSRTYLRKWFSEQMITLSLVVIHPVYATVYVSSLFRALGAKVGKNSEISTAANVTHTLLDIGEGAFIADAVSLGESDLRGQQLILEKTKIGDKSFVGNSALIPQGYTLPSDMLIGVLSYPPTMQELVEAQHCKDWFGSPSIALPRRQQSQTFDASLTTHPSKSRRLARSAVELIRIVIPQTAILCFSILFISFAHDLLIQKSLFKIVLLFPWYYLIFIGMPAFLITVLLKWVLIGKSKPANYPIWSWQVWRSEAVTVINEALSIPFLLFYLRGTPWLPILMRWFGTKTGKRVWMNTTDITEFDMADIGDEAALNIDCGPQTHLFEDRVMKIGPVKIGAQSSLGARTIILYDSEIAEHTQISALSLVMKGEKLPADTIWTGSPVKQAER